MPSFNGAMELHHKLRRDPNWHPNACNICGQLGHQAVNCTTGTINWKQIYGEDAFILKQPIYYSTILEKKKSRRVNISDLEKRAKEYAKMQAEAQGINYEDMSKKAQEMWQEAVANPTAATERLTVAVKEEPEDVTAKPGEVELPDGWAVAHDAAGKAYYWHKKTQKTQWDKPTVETPIE